MNATLYKFKSFDDFPAAENKGYTNDIILKSSLHFSAISDFNDPFDCRLSFQQEYTLPEITKYFAQLAKENPSNTTLKQYLEKYPDNKSFTDFRNRITNKLIGEIGVLSLAKNPNNILMWSHYSKKHTGLVFQFTFSESSRCFSAPLQVAYVKKYELLSYILDFKIEAPKLMLTKYFDWKYESEVRFIDLDYQGNKSFEKDELTSIIFGALAKDDDIDRMICLCKRNGFEHVKFSQARVSHYDFSLKFREILNSSTGGKS